tara:strand:- start:55 stop:297 length:243 start_codon:yes stop_codon:yes gene_type:complete
MVLSHVKDQPLYKTLRQYRLLLLVQTGFIGYLMWDLTMFYKEVYKEIPVESMGVLLGFLASLLGFFKWANDNSKLNEEDK